MSFLIRFFLMVRMISPTDSFMTVQGSTAPLSALEFQPLKDMMENLDDIIDDFMAKRMGNGEVFYGKRKYKPSNRPNTQGEYNGMGLSDKTKIEVVRDFKEELQKRRRQQQQQEQQQD